MPPLQTSLCVQLCPSLHPVLLGLLPPSTQVCTPVAQDVTPSLQALGLLVHAAPAVHATHAPELLQTMFVPQLVPVPFCVLFTHTIVPVVQVVMPVKQGFGFVAHAWLGVHEPQLPFPSQTRLVPQLTPPILLPLSAQVWAPVAQEVAPFLQTFGLVVHAVPAVQATQVPEPLQTMLVPQLTPGDLLPPSMQVWAPVEQEVVPFLQALVGFVLQATPAAQATQVPEPLQTMLVPQLAPADLLVLSTQVCAPVEHEVAPFMQTLGLVAHAVPTLHATQVPDPLHTMFVPQPRPGDLLVSSTQVCPPLEQEVAPFLHTFGLLVHDTPAVQAMQPPDPLQTMLAPQPVPPALGVPLAHICAPLMHDATPLWHRLGLPEQLCP